MGVIKSKNWPLAPKDRGWDAGAARGRITRWAGGPDKENINWDKLRQCFLWYDSEEPENLTSYRFPYVDIIDGEPHVVFRALAAIIAVLNGGRGGTNIPDSDREGVYREAAKQYRRFDEEPPELKRSFLMPEIEHRAFSLEQVEIREEGDSPKIVGYAAVFDQPSENLGGFTEVVRSTAFNKTLSDGADVRALWNHNPDYVLGRTKSGTLRLKTDDKGLWIEIDPPKTTWARDLMESIKRGDVDQMSFGFRTVRDRWTNNEENGEVLRELIEVQLFDVSPVTFPAYPQTEVYVRSAINQLQASIDSLRQLIPAPSLAGHPGKDEAKRRLELMRKRLELEEKAI